MIFNFPASRNLTTTVETVRMMEMMMSILKFLFGMASSIAILIKYGLVSEIADDRSIKTHDKTIQCEYGFIHLKHSLSYCYVIILFKLSLKDYAYVIALSI